MVGKMRWLHFLLFMRGHTVMTYPGGHFDYHLADVREFLRMSRKWDSL